MTVNRNVKKIIALIITLLVAAGFYLFKANTVHEEVDTQAMLAETESKDCMAGLEQLSDSSFMQGKTKITPDKNKGICYNDVLLPYDASSNTIYLPQTINDDNWHGTLTSEIIGAKVYTLTDDSWLNKKDAISSNHAFAVWLVTDNTYYEYNLCVTGMPIVWIQDGAKNGSQMVVFDPDNDEIIETSTKFRKKGYSSLTYPKKSYALNLISTTYETSALSLLGMRESNSWKLNSLYADDERIREMTACQLWQEIDEANPDINEAGPKMRYVELVMEDSYEGVYALVEPVDAEKLELDDNDVLYKSISWDVPTNDEIQESITLKKDATSAIEIKHPDKITGYEAVWAPMIDYNSWVYEGVELTYEEASQKVYPKNLYDYNLFIMAIGAGDNTYKNMYFAARVDDNGNSAMYVSPWDLDLTFGNTEKGSVYNNYSAILQVASLAKLSELNSSQVNKDYANLYFSYRETILSTEHIISLFESNRDYLVNTGAILREGNRWPVSSLSGLPVNTDLTNLEDYQTKRMEWLDEYYTKMLKEK